MEAAEAQDLICGAQDDGFLRYLAAYYLSKGMHPQALKCLQRLTVLAPGVWVHTAMAATDRRAAACCLRSYRGLDHVT
jgi:hypothetical protein